MTEDDKDLRLDLFGGPVLRLGNETIRLSPLQAALLGLVYGARADGISRHRAVEVLWADGDERRRRRRLNQALYALKARASQRALLVTTPDRILPDLKEVTCDLQEFDAALRNGDFATTQTLRSQGFLTRTSAFPVDQFQEWVEHKRKELNARERSLLRKAWSDAELSADWGKAKEVATALLGLEPNDEPLLQRALEVFLRAGSLDEAEEAVLEFGKRWEDRAGKRWVPSGKIREVMEKIRSTDGRPQGGLRQIGVAPTEVPPFCGRKEQLAALRRSLRQIPQEYQKVLLLTGEAGIGKTRLIREALVGLQVEGQQVFYAQLADLERLIPLNPLIEALADPQVADTLSQLAEPWRTVLYGAMPTHFPGEGPIPDPPEIQPGSVPRRLFEAVYQLFLALAEKAPIVMVLEDLHWADETTLSVLEFLSRRWDLGRFQLVVSYRTEISDTNPALTRLLRTLDAHQDRVEITLGELSPPASERLIRHLSPRDLPKREVDRLISLAGGNPFFLIELTLERSAGRLEVPTEIEDQVAIPLSIRQVLRQRLSQLSTEAEALLGALAVHRRSIETHPLGRLAKLSVAKCLQGLDNLHALRLVAREVDGVGIPHELIRHTVYQDLSDSRRAWLHERVARHLLRTRERPPVNELAIHFHHAGITEEARAYGNLAAQRAEQAGAIPEALRFLRIVREHTDDPREVADLLGRMGHLHYLHRNLREAAPLLEVASQRFRKHGRMSKALMFEIERIDSLAQTDLLPFPECLEELQRIKAESKAINDWDVFTKALDVEAHHLDFQGDIEGVRRVLREAEDAKDNGGLRARCQARATLALRIYYGSAMASLRSARRAVSVAENTGEVDLELLALNRLIVVLLYQGLLGTEEGARTVARAEQRLEVSGDLHLKFFVRMNQALWHLEIGELDRAESSFHLTGGLVKGTNAVAANVNLALNRGELALTKLDYLTAQNAYSEAEALLRRSSPQSFKVTINAGLGLCSLFFGDLAGARKREELLPPMEGYWAFDPTVAVTFKARMLERRAQKRAAAILIRRLADRVRPRFLTTWLKLILEENRILRKANMSSDRTRVKEALGVARNLRLNIREEQLSGLL